MLHLKMSFFRILMVLLANAAVSAGHPLWDAYTNLFVDAKYVDLTHAFEPNQPTYKAFSRATVGGSKAGRTVEGYVREGDEFTYAAHGFVATSYTLNTDQYGTQLDPPAHWNPHGATISDLPATYAVRPLVVINLAEKTAAIPGYHATAEDVLEWEARHGTVPAGSVVMFRTDWHKRWAAATGPGKDQATRDTFITGIPGVGLDALKLLHTKRDILFHGHEPLDTDDRGLEGEAWLMHNNYCQAEGVANLDLVPEAGALVSVGFAKPLGGTGGFARYIAIAPADWPHGVSVRDLPGAPLPLQPHPLKRGIDGVMRPTPEYKGEL
jgi:kynurenine formamidase